MGKTRMLVSILAGATILAGCASQSEPASSPQMTEMGRTRIVRVSVRTLPMPGAAVVPLLAGATPDETQPGGLSAEKRIVHGPGDPIYSEPQVPGGSKSLTVTTTGPFHTRDWGMGQTGYPDGRVWHQPRWFADPQDDVEFPCGTMDPSCEDVTACVTSTGRFFGNLVCLPWSAAVHPICQPECSDRTATLEQTDEGLKIRAAEDHQN